MLLLGLLIAVLLCTRLDLTVFSINLAVNADPRPVIKALKEAGVAVESFKKQASKSIPGGGGGGGGGGGFLGELKGQFGRGSQFGLLSKTLMGGGAIMGVHFATQALTQQADAMGELLGQYALGEIGLRKVGVEGVRLVPILGDLVKMWDSLTNAAALAIDALGYPTMTGDTLRYTKQLNEETAAAERALKVQEARKQATAELWGANGRGGMEAEVQRQYHEAVAGFSSDITADERRLRLEKEITGIRQDTLATMQKSAEIYARTGGFINQARYDRMNRFIFATGAQRERAAQVQYQRDALQEINEQEVKRQAERKRFADVALANREYFDELANEQRWRRDRANRDALRRTAPYAAAGTQGAVQIIAESGRQERAATEREAIGELRKITGAVTMQLAILTAMRDAVRAAGPDGFLDR